MERWLDRLSSTDDRREEMEGDEGGDAGGQRLAQGEEGGARVSGESRSTLGNKLEMNILQFWSPRSNSAASRPRAQTKRAARRVAITRAS